MGMFIGGGGGFLNHFGADFSAPGLGADLS
jgi:hypothetical protein